MSYIVNDKEMAAVLALPAPKRYQYFIGKVTDWNWNASMMKTRAIATSATSMKLSIVS